MSGAELFVRLLVLLHLRPAPRRAVGWLHELTPAERAEWDRPQERPRRRWLDRARARERAFLIRRWGG